MTATVPKGKPRITREKLEKLAPPVRVEGVHPPVELVGLRGYYRDSMGAVGRNDRGLWDDALILRTPEAFVAFNANTDPSPWGINPKLGRGYAMLTVGVWLYKLGIHKRGKPGGHAALVQAAPVIVDRRLQPDDEELLHEGWFGINIHRGGLHTTGSEGCQTIYRPQWDAFITLLTSELTRHWQHIVPYTLIETQG